MPGRTSPKLGQHFLADARYRRRIAEAANLRPDDLVVEIGAGRGAMTPLLAERARRVVAVEVDRQLADHLQREFASSARIEVRCADILATDIGEICRRHQSVRCFIFGNLPYYITSPIIHHVFEAGEWIRGALVLVQREVAERLTAKPGSRAYGYLSVLTRFHAEPRLLFNVPPGAFSPPPKVHSSLVELRLRNGFAGRSREDAARLLDFVKDCFAQKRKNLLNNLSASCTRGRVERALASLELSHRLRAEQLAPDQFAALFDRLRQPD